MYLLDTDRITILQHGSGERFDRLRSRLQLLRGQRPVCVCIINIEEQMRGWMAVIAKERKAERQISSYRELGRLFTFYARFRCLLFDERAAQQFNSLPLFEGPIGNDGP